MPRGPKKGAFTASAETISPNFQPVDDAIELSTVSGLGYELTDRVTVNLSEFSNTPLVINHLEEIRGIIRNKAPATVKKIRMDLREIQTYTKWYECNKGPAPTKAEEVDAAFTHHFITFQIGREISESYKCSYVRSFKRYLTAISVPLSLLPPNPFRGGSENGVKDTLDYPQAKLILDRAKLEISVVQRRAREAHQLASRGHDPRREAGGEQGDWQKPENRAWVIKRLLRREIHSWDKMRLELGYRNVLAGLEGKPGAEVVGEDGCTFRMTGWKGHLRWFFPWPGDLAPFATLVMLRTGWNMSTVANMQSRRWLECYPFSLRDGAGDSHVYVVSFKTRGRGDPLQPSKKQRHPSDRRPRTYPYRLLKSVEYITAGLRKEIWRKRSVLMSLKRRTADEDLELEKLESIKNDLFICKTEQGISSFRWMVTKEGTVEYIGDFLRRAGVPSQSRNLRDSAIIFSYETSGQNLFVAQVLAQHSDPNVTALYLRRARTLDRIWNDAVRIFDSSLRLIEAGEFSVDKIRAELRSQGFSEKQIGSLMDPQNTTRWGNRCADPSSPPGGFDRRSSGGECRLQDCIDGCPHARWFSESAPHVARQLASAEKLLEELGSESTEGSSLRSRADRCKALLRRWPVEIAAQAMQKASMEAPAEGDLFFGPAL